MATVSQQACAVMSLERVPADIRKQGGVARMTDPKVQWIISFGVFFVTHQ